MRISPSTHPLEMNVIRSYQRHQTVSRADGPQAAIRTDPADPGMFVRLSTSISREDFFRQTSASKNPPMDRLKRAYRQLAQQYHPDKSHHLGETYSRMAEARFQEIQPIYAQMKSLSERKGISKVIDEVKTRIRASEWEERIRSFIVKRYAEIAGFFETPVSRKNPSAESLSVPGGAPRPFPISGNLVGTIIDIRV